MSQQLPRRRLNRAWTLFGLTVVLLASSLVIGLTSRLRDAVDLEVVRADLLAAVNSAVEPAQISMWLAGDGRNRRRDGGG